MDFFDCSRCKLSDIKPNFSELARFYDLDRRQRLADYYNENFNAIRHRMVNGCGGAKELVARRSYRIGSSNIYGYGVPAY